ncbi:MAG: hypothetical protein JWO54_404 [Candidatus Saccharibacteria bacterium]|nr:hypothetical protein [Candidatus Saccharibacteria bacterium]MDB5180644.1 hypothetical protein [Candidatus Saccharibacteria bacterium]
MKYSQQSTRGISRPIVIGIVLAVLIIGGLVALFASGVLKVSPNIASSNNAGLCKDIIGKYNTAFTQTSADAYGSILADSAKAAATINNNQADPNCVFIQFTNAMYTQNVSDTGKFAGVLKDLSKEGKYITGQLDNPLSLKAIEENAQLITSPDSVSPNSSLKGNG